MNSDSDDDVMDLIFDDNYITLVEQLLEDDSDLDHEKNGTHGASIAPSQEGLLTKPETMKQLIND
ncbi:hypothetical protein HDU79_011631 [Rhizoclosmatium sp. JEL0117]|nr:hypothetical protein HDU79_011631 [Rhizoclosmatium sp. JEL0117]